MNNSEKNKMRKLSLREVQLQLLDAMIDIDKVCKQYNIKYYLIGGSCLGAVRHGGFIPWDFDIDIAMFREDYERFQEIFYEGFDKTKYFLQTPFTDKSYASPLIKVGLIGTFKDSAYLAHIDCFKGLYVDIFPLDNVPNSKYKMYAQAVMLYIFTKLIRLKFLNPVRGGGLERILRRVVSFFSFLIPSDFLKKLRHNLMRKYQCCDSTLISSMGSHYGYLKQVMPRTIYGNPKKMIFENVELNLPEETHGYLTNIFGSDYMLLPSQNKRVLLKHDVYLLDR